MSECPPGFCVNCNHLVCFFFSLKRILPNAPTQPVGGNVSFCLFAMLSPDPSYGGVFGNYTLLFGRLRHRNTSYVQHDNIIFLVLSQLSLSSLLPCNLSVDSAMHLNLSLAKTSSFIDWLNVRLAFSQRAYVGHNLRAFFLLVVLIFLLFMCSSTGWQIRSNEVDGDWR